MHNKALVAIRSSGGYCLHAWIQAEFASTGPQTSRAIDGICIQASLACCYVPALVGCIIVRKAKGIPDPDLVATGPSVMGQQAN